MKGLRILPVFLIVSLFVLSGLVHPLKVGSDAIYLVEQQSDNQGENNEENISADPDEDEFTLVEGNSSPSRLVISGSLSKYLLTYSKSLDRSLWQPPELI